MPCLFAVTRSQAAAWERTRPLEAQRGWRAHADFMNALHKGGFVVIGGPLEGTPDTLLIIRAENAAEIRERLSKDPWGDDMLHLARVVPWDVRLGSVSIGT
jgi:uncharacterized protein YciI